MSEKYISAGNKIFPYKNAWVKYQWSEKVDGIPIRENTLHIAVMAGKDVLLKLKGCRKHYAISPHEAFRIAKERRSYFHDKQNDLVAVIPKSACYAVEKA